MPRPKTLREPLHILVTDPTIVRWEEIVKLREQGHHVARLAGRWDVVLGPNCECMDELLHPIIDTIIEEARARAYPGK